MFNKYFLAFFLFFAFNISSDVKCADEIKDQPESLYLVTTVSNNIKIRKSSDAKEWSDISPKNDIKASSVSTCVFKGKLYLASFCDLKTDHNIEMQCFDGNTWKILPNAGKASPSHLSLSSYDNPLTSEKELWLIVMEGGKIPDGRSAYIQKSFDGETWHETGFYPIHTMASNLSGLCSFENALYWSTAESSPSPEYYSDSYPQNMYFDGNEWYLLPGSNINTRQKSSKISSISLQNYFSQLSLNEELYVFYSNYNFQHESSGVVYHRFNGTHWSLQCLIPKHNETYYTIPGDIISSTVFQDNLYLATFSKKDGDLKNILAIQYFDGKSWNFLQNVFDNEKVDSLSLVSYPKGDE
jgi:hypothetical protein